MYIPELHKKQLFDRLYFTLTKKEVLWLVREFTHQKIDIEELISLTTSSNYSLAFHSAWVLENIFFNQPKALDYYLPRIIELLPKIENTSVRRHYAKLVANGIRRVVRKQASKGCERELWTSNLESLEEVCFKWFVEEDTKPAVKAYCLDILYFLSTRERWIAEELPHIIENQLEHGSPGLRAKGKAILKLLR